MTLEPEAREAKLPIWARDLLSGLRRRAEDATARAEDARLATNPDESEAQIRRLMDGPIGLGRHITVRFRDNLETPLEHYNGIEVQVTSRGVRVSSSDGGLQIHPQAGNSVLVKRDR